MHALILGRIFLGMNRPFPQPPQEAVSLRQRPHAVEVPAVAIILGYPPAEWRVVPAKGVR